MKRPFMIGCALLLCLGCKNDPAPNRRPPRSTPSAAADAATNRAPAVPEARTEVTTTDLGDAAVLEGTGVRVFRVGESQCVRDPARNNLGIGVHGVWGTGRIELELRNVRYSCTPVPEYTASVEGSALVIRVQAAARAALTRCACRHDQFLQVVNVPEGDLTVRVEELASADASTGTLLGTGRIDQPVAPPAASAPSSAN